MKKRLSSKLLTLLLVLALALAVLPTMAFAEGATDCTGTCDHEAAIGTTHYDTLAEAMDAVQAGETVTLLKDVTVSDTLYLTKSITIDGNGKVLNSSSTDNYKATLMVNETTADLTIQLKNLKVVGPEKGSATNAIALRKNTGNVKLMLDGCTLETPYYALNIKGGNENVQVDIQNSTLTGYSAVQTWSANSKVNVKNSTLIGLNSYAKDELDNNWFDTIALLADTGSQATDSVLTFESCIIKAIQTAPDKARQGFFTFHTSGVVTCINCTFEKGSAGVDGTTTAMTFDEAIADEDTYCIIGYTFITPSKDTVATLSTSAVALIGNKGYTTVQAAVDAAESGDTVKLLKDVTEGVSVVSGKNITLNLNGKNITAAATAITNYGTLKLTGNGTVSAGTSYVIDNCGVMTISGGVKVCKPSGSTSTASLIRNLGSASGEAYLTINGGQFVGESGSMSCAVVKNDDYGVLEIYGGTFDSSNSKDKGSSNTTILNWHKATIHDGTFIGAYPISNGRWKGDARDAGEFTINGGTFTGLDCLLGVGTDNDGTGFEVTTSGKLTINGGSFTAPAFGKEYGEAKLYWYQIAITGGTYSMDPTGYVADGYIARKDRDGYTVLARRDLMPGVYTSDPTGALAWNCYISRVDTVNGLWTVSRYVSSGTTSGGKDSAADSKNDTVWNRFVDVPANAYYYDAVQWAVENGVTDGMDESHFAPNQSCTRAQIVTFLWRAAGCPTPAGRSGFADVRTSDYYAAAVAWAVENGITTGMTESSFEPDAACTRAQVVTFLLRFAAYQGMDAVTMQELVSGFGDAAQVPGYALSAFNWALASGIVEGYNGLLMPNDTCTRSQIVTILYRLLGE